jgi:hypothetical protein
VPTAAAEAAAIAAASPIAQAGTRHRFLFGVVARSAATIFSKRATCSSMVRFGFTARTSFTRAKSCATRTAGSQPRRGSRRGHAAGHRDATAAEEAAASCAKAALSPAMNPFKMSLSFVISSHQEKVGPQASYT